ncbi:MAG: aminoglycoside phosphotransferase family protein [Clostridiales bacterium]|nr:aminoglycoside phosphotransferase family protein [Clostridiales bacterium]
MDCTIEFENILDEFLDREAIMSVSPYGEGHINGTFLVETKNKKYILQQINTKVFPDVEKLMENIIHVTNFLVSKNVTTLEVIKTQDGRAFTEANGKYFRMYTFIENSVTYQQSESAEIFEESGYAFGCFQKHLSDFDASSLYETIPDFHNTPKRFNDFMAAYNEDKCGRLKDCKKEAEFIIQRKNSLSLITDGIKDGSIPLRVTHNDTKLNNILMNPDTGKARAIIDLDTVMPGSMLYDFGDSIRFGASTAEEDEPDTEKVHFDISLYNAYKNGFIRAMGSAVTPAEEELMPYSAYLMTIECGMRFLTDFLSGDTYFKTKYPEHNLVRCRTQLKLVSEMEQIFNLHTTD